MRSRYLIIVAAVVMLAGCGGIVGSGENGTADVTDPDENVTEVGQSDSEPSSEPEPEANLEISEISVEQLLTYNQSQVGSVVVENTGNKTGGGNLSVILRQQQLVAEEIELSAGESTEFTFETEGLQYPEGEYTIQATLNSEFVEEEFTVDHPSYYGKTTIDLYVNDTRVDREITDLVRESTGFWEQNGEMYLGYPVEYNIVDDERSADKTLEFTNVESCGLHVPVVNSTYLGCADVPETDVAGQTTAEVQYNLSDPMMQETITHELGHTLGLDHSDMPQYVMEDSSSSRISPNDTKVFFRAQQGSVPTSQKRAAERTLNHFANDRGDLDAEYGFSWSEVDSAKDAHIVITFDALDGTCGFDNGGSCVVVGDYDTQMELVIDDLDSEVVSWHVGAMLAPELYDEHREEFSGEVERSERENWPK